MSEDKRFLEISLGQDDAPLTFASGEELIAWFEDERSNWTWLAQPPVVNDKRVRGASGRYDNFASLLSQAYGQFRNDANLDSFRTRVQDAFTQNIVNKRIAITRTKHGARILAIIERHGSTDDAKLRAAHALHHICGIEEPAPFTASYARLMIAAMHDYYGEEGSARSSDKALDAVLKESNRELVKRQRELDTCIETFLSQMGNWQTKVETAIQNNNDKTTSAISDITSVKELFEKHMGLQAPVQYWTDKARSHQRKTATYRWALILFGILALTGCLTSYGFVFNYVVIQHGEIQNALSASLLALGALAVLSTAVLWGIRILSRLYLSQHHLAIDAEERATMVTTYLALANEKAVDEKDRAIVLAALFRPTGDGIVKEEAPPMITPAALMTNFIRP